MNMANPDSSLGWFNKRDSAAFLGVTVGHFDRLYRPHLSTSDVRQAGKALVFRGPAVFAVAMTLRSGGDPEMVGDSPNLERYRGAKADLAQLDLKEREGTLVDVVKLKPGLLLIFSLLREATRRLASEYGNESAALITEALDESSRRISEMYPEDGQQ
jgi:hypothetical protein